MIFVGRFVGILKIVLENIKLKQRHMINIGCLFRHHFGIVFDMQLDSVDRFFKYSDTEGARFILRDGTLKFSIASKFNDPFDASIQTLFAYDPVEKLSELLQEQINILFSDENYPPFVSGEIQQKMAWMRKNLFPATQNKKDQLKKALLEQSSESIWDLNRLRIIEAETLVDVKRIFSSDAIFCASLTCDNQLLWSHYAKDHSGVALEFEPSVAKDSILRLMTRVIYSNDRPVFYKSPKDFMFKSMFRESRDVNVEFARSIMMTKNTRWSYEQEVRMYIPMYIHEKETYRLDNYYPEELKAIYLGCKTQSNDERELVKLAISKNSDVNVFKMKMSQTNYDLVPVQVDKDIYL